MKKNKSMREEMLDWFDDYVAKVDAREVRALERMRQRNLDRIRKYRKSLVCRTFARGRAGKLSYLDRMEAYVEKYAWLPKSYSSMLGLWFDKERPGEIELYSDFVPLK